MSWRKIREEDIERGTVVRLSKLEDGYGDCTIISVTPSRDGLAAPHVLLARPMALAHEAFNAKQPMLSCEVFEMSLDKVLSEHSDVQVWETAKGIRRMVT